MDTIDDNDRSPTRRDVIKTGASLWAVPAAIAAAGAMANAQAAAAPAGDGRAASLIDPRSQYPKPPFPPQQQELPGLVSKMQPRPDHGETSYKGSGQLFGRRALITGGDSGIGRAAAIAYAREGADVAINYLPVEESDAQEVVALIKAEGRKAVAIPGDITDETFCRQLVEDAARQLGGLDLLVNNAATQMPHEKLEDLDTQQFDRVFKTNVYAMFWITKAALAHLPAGAAIINTSSIQAYDPSPTMVDYAQTKACIVSFTKSMAKQLSGRGIRVNAVAPGPFWTPLQPASVKRPEDVTNIGAGTEFGRVGQPVELSPLYVMLASHKLSYATGEVFGSSGGKSPF